MSDIQYGTDKQGETWKMVESDEPGFIDLFHYVRPFYSNDAGWHKWSEVHESDIESITAQLGINFDKWYNHQH